MTIDTSGMNGEQIADLMERGAFDIPPEGKLITEVNPIQQSGEDPEHLLAVTLSLIRREGFPKIHQLTENQQKRIKRFCRGMYMWDTDAILIAPFGTITDDEWLMVFLHELGHATGHVSRLDRQGAMSTTGNDTPQTEAREELTAWRFTDLAIRHLSCQTPFIRYETEQQIKRWALVLDAEDTYAALQDGDKAFLFFFNKI